MKNTPVVKALSAAGLLSLLAGGVGSAAAAEIDDVKAQMGKLQNRIDQLEAAQKGGNSAGSGTSGTTAGGTSFSVGGYVQLDAIYDFKGDQGRAVDMTALPLAGSAGAARKGTTTFSARTSRLNFKTSTPIEDTAIKTRVEFDFFTADGSETFTNGAHPRLRHAYGQVGNWLAGQTWSTFMDVDSLPETLEFTGPSGQVFIRQPMLRYTFATGAKSSLALAVENPQSDSRDAGGTVTAQDRGPDLAANWTTEGDWGHLSLRGLVRPLRAEDGNGANQASSTGYGAGVSGILKLGTATSVLYQFNAGKGAGRYIQDANPAAGYSATPATLSAQKSVGGFLGVQQSWGGSARSTLVYGMTRNDNDAGFGPIAGLNKSTSEVHANLIYSPYKQVDVGLEYVWGERKLEDGQKGELSRLQGAVKFSF